MKNPNTHTHTHAEQAKPKRYFWFSAVFFLHTPEKAIKLIQLCIQSGRSAHASSIIMMTMMTTTKPSSLPNSQCIWRMDWHEESIKLILCWHSFWPDAFLCRISFIYLCIYRLLMLTHQPIKFEMIGFPWYVNVCVCVCAHRLWCVFAYLMKRKSCTK